MEGDGTPNPPGNVIRRGLHFTLIGLFNSTTRVAPGAGMKQSVDNSPMAPILIEFQ